VTAYEIGALLIVFAVPFVLVLVVAGIVAWARDSVHRSTTIGVVGIAATTVALGYSLMERTCGVTVNRPLIMALLGPGDCRRTGLAALELVLLLALGTALAVRVLPASIRR
jgi:hypothetical protein